MKKVVLTFGLISGAVVSAMMLLAIPFHDELGFESSVVVGYTTMVIAFLLIFFGVRSYRDNVAGGTVRFGRAFTVGASIGVIASLFYVATWQVVYFNFMPDFLTRYHAQMIERARANGESEAVIAETKAEFDRVAVQYNNPLFNAAYTIIEPLPVALLVALVSAGVLSRKRLVST